MKSLNNEPKIIVFLCQWSPHAAFQALQDTLAPIPRGVRMVRVPCSGRISKSLLLKAFESGADGVALIGCEPGSCRYGIGTGVAERNVDDTQGILELLGLGKDRLRFAAFYPERSSELLEFLVQFSQSLEALGKSPVKPHAIKRPEAPRPDQVKAIVDAHNVSVCQDCGKCSSACPVSLSGKPFSPRALAAAVLSGDYESASVQNDLWSCLTCGLCYDRCPSAVNFPEFVRDMRRVGKGEGDRIYQAHEGFFHALMRMMTSPELKVDHWGWLPPDVRTDPNGKVLFFGGCSPYFDAFFKNHLGVRTSAILTDALRLLNFFDIHPALLPGERCCGHDLLWSGDEENFLELARINVAAIKAAGVEEIVTACPECYRTLAVDYPQRGADTGLKVTHIFELAEREIGKGAVGFGKLNRKITFQDPCRLARIEGGQDMPRNLIARLDTLGFSEMRDRGVSALCCGNSAWMGCDAYTKQMQVRRLRQARQTGSDLLVTACPKCQIHLRCAMEDPFLGDEIRIEMMDLTSVLANTIRWE